MGLSNYAELSLAVLKEQLGMDEFVIFEQVYKEKMLKILENQKWENQNV